MHLKQGVERTLGAAAVLFGAAAASYAGFAGSAWLRYGRPSHPAADEIDPVLDAFMPEYEVAERHRVFVHAPVEVTFGALMDLDLDESLLVRAIFKGREVLLRARPAEGLPRGLVALTKSLGWGVLAELPGQEIVMGAVTRPWEANVVFRSIPSGQFAAFDEPGYVKIVWTLRADANGPLASVARSETRVLATDASARRRFRWYWARFSAGIVLIRKVSLQLVKKSAERRARNVRESSMTDG